MTKLCRERFPTGPSGKSQISVRQTDGDVPANVRRNQILTALAGGSELRIATIAKELRCSTKTVKRDLEALKDEHPIEFVGPAKTGHYRIRPK